MASRKGIIRSSEVNVNIVYNRLANNSRSQQEAS